VRLLKHQRKREDKEYKEVRSPKGNNAKLPLICQMALQVNYQAYSQSGDIHENQYDYGASCGKINLLPVVFSRRGVDVFFKPCLWNNCCV
jgi:hypothetical protein